MKRCGRNAKWMWRVFGPSSWPCLHFFGSWMNVIPTDNTTTSSNAPLRLQPVFGGLLPILLVVGGLMKVGFSIIQCLILTENQYKWDDLRCHHSQEHVEITIICILVKMAWTCVLTGVDVVLCTTWGIGLERARQMMKM